MSFRVHCADLEGCLCSEQKSELSHVEDCSCASSAALLQVEHPQTSRGEPCSDSDDFSSARSSDDLQNFESVETEAEEEHGIEYHSEHTHDTPEAPLMPPLPRKLLSHLKSTCESRDESSLAMVASESDTGKAALDGILPSSDHAEHTKTTASSTQDEELFTVMLKNIPCCHSKEDCLDLLTAHGWGDSYNFFHLPVPKKPSRGCKGYAFVGFEDPNMTKRFMQEMKGVSVPGRKNTKVLDVVPARLQGLQENLSQFANSNAYGIPSASTCLSSKDTLPLQESGANASETQQPEKSILRSDFYEDAALMPPCYWNPMQSGFRSSPDMWSDSLQCERHRYAPQACDIEELCMHIASRGPPANSNSCSLPPGFMLSCGAQSSTSHSYWNPDHNKPEEHLASELERLGIESEENAEREGEGQAVVQNRALHAACSDDGFECTEIVDDDEDPLTVMMKNIPCRCSQQEVLDLLAIHGWADAFNFFHLPARPSSCEGCKGCLGYAFIGFPDARLTRQFMHEMKGVSFLTRKSAKVLDIVPARYQGLRENLAHLSGRKVNQSSRAPICRNHAGISQEMYGTMSF